MSVAQVARRYALHANLIFKWLKDPRFAPSSDELEGTVEAPLFLPVDVRAEPAWPAVPVTGDTANGEVEIALASGHRVTVRGAFDGEALARLLQGLASS